MTFKEFMQENGYDLITTFWGDFSIADKYGIAGVKDSDGRHRRQVGKMRRVPVQGRRGLYYMA